MRLICKGLVCRGLVLLAAVGALSGPVAAQEAPRYTEPLGIALEAYPYPYPVQMLPLSIEGQGVRMAYMDVAPVGAANGQAVVLLHGKNFYGSYWENTIRTLTAAGFRVVVPDQIGFGKSSKPDIHYSFDLLAQNTAQLLDSLHIDRAVIVGHSMGGMLAVRFARTYPQRTVRLVLEDPIGLEDYRFAIPPQSLEQAVEAEVQQTPEAYRAYVHHYFVTWKPEYERFVETRVRVALSGEFARWAKSAALTSLMIYQQPVRHEFRLIQPPTLLIIGEQDRTVVGGNRVSPDVLKTLGNYPQLGRAAAREIPDCKLVQAPRCGHIPHLEAPDIFHRALLDFLRQ
jgi:pimeloyl-ACP methyl ester carboxylesterase